MSFALDPALQLHYDCVMKYRSFPHTKVPPVSVIGFGVWTISTGWWGQFTDEEGVRLLQRAFDVGINFFDAADTYGNGRSEELLAQAFANKRDQVVIATKVGYDFYSHSHDRRGQREIPHDFSIPFIRKAVDMALKRLKTDYIDLLQLHNIRFEQVEDDALWALLEELKKEGKILGHGAALGPAIGWMYEGVDCIQKRKPDVLQHIYNLFEQHPGKPIMQAADEDSTRFLIRVPHASGMLEGRYTAETKFPQNDHRNHRPRSWLTQGLKKVETIRFLENKERTLGQASLLWILSNPKVASCLPNIYNEEQLLEFAKTTSAPPLTPDELQKLETLAQNNFGVPEEDAPKFKGTMERSMAAI